MAESEQRPPFEPEKPLRIVLRITGIKNFTDAESAEIREATQQILETKIREILRRRHDLLP